MSLAYRIYCLLKLWGKIKLRVGINDRKDKGNQFRIRAWGLGSKTLSLSDSKDENS